MTTQHTVVMVTTSYPRFPGDLTGTFLEPIAHGVANRGHRVHVVAPWHPDIQRPAREGNVHFHFYQYAPSDALNVFGYASALKADTSMRLSAYAVTPFALYAGLKETRRVIQTHRATMVHAHWVIPNGFIASLASRSLPLVVSLHGSDVYVAEKYSFASVAARRTFAKTQWVTACSEDLRSRALRLGASNLQSEVIPYGVDIDRFQPNSDARLQLRSAHSLTTDHCIVLCVGRLVRKKGFEYLIDAVASLAKQQPTIRLVVAGDGDLGRELRERADQRNIADRIIWLGAITQQEVADWLAVADIVAVPSVRDSAGNVDGLPNVVLEALASATPVITTTAGGIGSVAIDHETALVVPEQDANALAEAIETLRTDRSLRVTIGRTAREYVRTHNSWTHLAERFESVYEKAVQEMVPS